MTARDIIHDAVRAALIKDGWAIVVDPFVIEYQRLRLFADLAADRSSPAERSGRRIIVEIKSFLGPSFVHDLELALGQYQMYHAYLEQIAPDAELFLAVPLIVYEKFFVRRAVRLVVDRFRIALLVVDVHKQEVVKWITGSPTET